MVARSITCLGDSITDGVGDPNLNGYRLQLNARLAAALPGTTLSWIGGITSGDAPTNNHEGAVGATTSTFIGIIPTLFGAGNPYSPSGLIVMIGVNDASTQAGADAYAANYGTMLDSLFTQLPSAGIVVSYITPSNDIAQNARIAVMNTQLDAIWDARIGAGKIIEKTPLHRVYQPASFNAGVHPNSGGYAILADDFVAPTVRMLGRLP